MISLVSLLSMVALALAQGPATVNTPTQLTTCQPAAITFSGGTAPYFISVLPGGQVSGAPLQNYPVQNTAGTYTWIVNIAAGTSITLQIRDATGVLNYSQAVTILAGTDTSCIGMPQPGASTAAGASSASVPPASTAPGASSAVSASSAAATSASTAVSASSPAVATSARPTTSAPAPSSSAATGVTSTQAPAATTARAGAVSTSFNVAAVLGAAALVVLA